MVAASDDSFAIGCGYRCLDITCNLGRRIIATRFSGAGVRTHGYEYGSGSDDVYLFACALAPDEKTMVLAGYSDISRLHWTYDQFIMRIRTNALSAIMLR